ncbi:MAG: hypothetical protein V4547_16460 [Bacteroidota bacterium]
MSNDKQVRIIGLSVVEQFGALKACELQFNEENRLVMIKGEVGAGKTTMQNALRLGTQGSATLQDKSLYGDINLVTQLADGDKNLFVGCKTNAAGELVYVLYMIDADGNKIENPVIDGEKATPAKYLKTLQTALTWRLNELTSQNPTTVRNILLELYSQELAAKGVIFDKAHPKYVGGIIDQIEKAKEQRNVKDMLRKQVGGIADDMLKKGIDFDDRKQPKPTKELEDAIAVLKAEIETDKKSPEVAKEKELTALRLSGSELKDKLRLANDAIIETNKPIQAANAKVEERKKNSEGWCNDILELLKKLLGNDEAAIKQLSAIRTQLPKEEPAELNSVLVFNEKGTCTSLPEEFKDNKEIFDLLTQYRQIGTDYAAVNAKPLGEADVTKKQGILEGKETKLQNLIEYNKEAAAVNAFHDWREANDFVKGLNKDYFMKLTDISTGVEGLFICPEYETDEDGSKVAKGNDLYLMYDGSYDVEYFNNPDKTLRKLSAYSDTQKPMICLLVQKYLLNKKVKTLPYLWIDQVPIDNKTKALLDRMSEELGLWLFVNWTGDFDKTELKDGEILIENGEVFHNLKPIE